MSSYNRQVQENFWARLPNVDPEVRVGRHILPAEGIYGRAEGISPLLEGICAERKGAAAEMFPTSAFEVGSLRPWEGVLEREEGVLAARYPPALPRQGLLERGEGVF
jgi:hypothetical protein